MKRVLALLFVLALNANAQTSLSTLAQCAAVQSVAHIVITGAGCDAYTAAQLGSLPAYAKTSAVATTPTMGTCGTSPSVVGTNANGTITVGSGVVTSCVMTFAAGGFPAAPSCRITPSLALALGVAATGTTMTATTGATVGGGKLYYACVPL